VVRFFILMERLAVAFRDLKANPLREAASCPGMTALKA
jgi:hypothetical protein